MRPTRETLIGEPCFYCGAARSCAHRTAPEPVNVDVVDDDARRGEEAQKRNRRVYGARTLVMREKFLDRGFSTRTQPTLKAGD